MSVYLTPPLSAGICESLRVEPGSRIFTGDDNAEAKTLAKSVGWPIHSYRDHRDRARLDRFIVTDEQAAKLLELGAIEETFDEYAKRVDRRAELLEENARDSER